MALDENVSNLIGRIYESAESPAAWQRLLEDIRTHLGAKCLMQTTADLGHGHVHQSVVIGDQLRPEGVEEYKAHAFELDASFRWASRHPDARYCDTEDLFFSADDNLRDEFTRWNLNEWIGSRNWIVGYTAPGDELTFGLSVHPWAEATLPADKKRLFKMLFEHMDRAMRLNARAPLLFDGSKPQVLIDCLGYVRGASQAARELLGKDDGLSIWDGRLHATDGAANGRLVAAMRSALAALSDGGFGGAVAIPRQSGRRDLLLTVVPLINPPSPFHAFRPAALVQIVEPESPFSASAAAHCAQLFGFTQAEAHFADVLMNAEQNLRQAADELGITYSTARVHLKHLLEKTGTHSQAQLSRLLSRVE